ncbi:MAG: ACP S-malonyltransferase [Firmicutes bacterium]|jgi:[acyl-carrier-protein] S-malonyltransferase|nr:ACP S-malonyltransferase [Bacillota bacterium]
MKIAFIFPGQGAQYVEMGKELADKYPEVMETFLEADKAIDFDLSKMCFEGPEEDLNKTEYTQPTVLATSYALYKILENRGVKPEAVAGLSLGEYTGLVVGGAIDFQDALRLVQKRGKYMQEEVPLGVGGMAAIMGMEKDPVLEVCELSKEFGIVEPANFNCPKQIVLAGELGALEKAVEIAKEKGAKKAVMLPVSAPFHSSMLKGAGEKLSKELENVEVKELNIPLVTNVTGDYVKSEDIKEMLKMQVSSSVLWENCMEKLIADGFDTFVEIGPGKSLSKFMKRISKEVKCVNIEDVKSLEKAMTLLGLEG